MSRSTIESRTLEKAAEVLGGRRELAKHLQVPLLELDKWLVGAETPPHIYFLRAVDVVLYQDSIEPSAPGDAPPSDLPRNKPDYKRPG